MRVVFLLFLIGLQLSPASAQDAWEGLRKIEDIEVPFQKAVMDSVVRFYGPYSKKDPSLEPEVVQTSKAPRNLDAGYLIANLRQLQIETCRKQKLDKCPIFESFTGGTGFFQNGTIFRTCRHNFHNWIYWAAKLNNKKPMEISPPMILIDRKNQSVYIQPLAKKKNVLRFSFLADGEYDMPFDPRLSYAKPSKLVMNRLRLGDFAEMKSDGPIVKTHEFKIGKLKQNIDGKDIYLFGYPPKLSKIGNDEINTDGISLYGTVGRYKKVNPLTNGIETTNFSYLGMSGSPAFTGNGELIGITCSVYGTESVKAATASGQHVKEEVVEGVSAIITEIDREQLSKLWADMLPTLRIDLEMDKLSAANSQPK